VVRGIRRRGGDDVLVSVVLDPGHDEEIRAASVASLEAQTHNTWELVDSVEGAAGEYVAFLDAADEWVPDRLSRLLATRAAFVADRIEGTRGNNERVLLGDAAWDVEPAQLLARRQLLLDGGIDESTGAAWVLDFMLRNEQVLEVVKEVGIRRRFPDRRKAMRPRPGNHRDAVLNRHLVPWAALAPRRPGLTSVIIPTYEDSDLTTACVESLMADPDPGALEVVVWDNGSARGIGKALDALGQRHDRVTVHHSPRNDGFALGNNRALAEAHGELVVFLNNDTTVSPGWLAPLRAALEDPDVLGVQPLLVYPTWTVQSAGVAFPTTGGLPHNFLAGFPVEDAARVDGLRFHALTGAALAMRFEDAVAMRGFDPVFTNGMEDVDLCLRLAAHRPGHFRVVPDVPVVHHESRSPGRYARSLANREVYLDRWQGRDEPRDDAALWAACGLRVVDHEVGPTRHGEPPRFRIPRPVLVRESRLVVSEAEPTLRWALKNPAPAGPGGERWGDTHFADSLATALRGLGQEVVVDRRPEFDRASGRHDDVVLVLRGLVRHDPSPEQVSLLWVISHPADVAEDEAHGYDRVVAAGAAWAERRSREWGRPIGTLLQATDPQRFHPDAAEPDTGQPVLFVGNSRRRLRPVVRDALAAGLPLAVHGDLWAGLVPDDVVRGRSIPNRRLAAAYAGAGVVLNDHWDDMREGGFVSNRLFDAVASGARVVSDEVAGIAGLFGDSVQVYRDVDDLRRLATLPDPDAVFGDRETRRRTAERVRSEHSFAARAEMLVSMAREARRDRGLG
jgi:O-antigen biosynthesis protein